VTGGRVPWTADEIMTITAARALRGRRSCFVGIGLPSTAANLARRLYQTDLVLIYESGTIGDGELARTADAVVPVPEVFNYWLQPGRIDVGFLGAAQLDRYGNINTTVVGGSYDRPAVRLPGAGGAPEIASSCAEVVVMLRHSTRALVERVDFVTSVGYGNGPGHRERLGLRGRGPVLVITDLGILRPDPDTLELTLYGVHPGVDAAAVRAATGWPLSVAGDLATTPEPDGSELAALRDLRKTLEPGEAP
jgi:glutaconate CoA-transferase subunit B